ncbi:MAG: hypothetical protein UR26_C0005G0018 [candidate division TM6 bacterium GW2011_GWF2_32_72]|nr:MAG: hypothetical protein UR26_C0005G0018 [candidate division TM6 bacterium GW2011_GWF2_32_72]
MLNCSHILTLNSKALMKKLLLILTCYSCLFTTVAAEIKYYKLERNLPYPYVAHILEVNPKENPIHLETATEFTQGRKPASEFDKGYSAVINGSFWLPEENGAPEFMLKKDNKWMSMPRTALLGTLGWSNKGQDAEIDIVGIKYGVKIDDEIIPVANLNGKIKDNNIVVFTPTFGTTTKSSENRTEISVSNKQIKSIKTTSNTNIPKNGFVISIGPDAEIDLNKFKENSSAEFIYQFEFTEEATNKKELNNKWNNFENIVDANPILINNGQINTNINKNNSRYFAQLPHPRTAVGLKPDGTWVFVALDGRQLLYSLGASLNTLAYLMLELGCDRALNLDGGGSTTMILNGEIINNPSGERKLSIRKIKEKQERPIGHAICIE